MKRKNKIYIIISFAAALAVTFCVFFFRQEIGNCFRHPVISAPSFEGGGVSGSEFFENLGKEENTEEGDLGEGKISYNALAENYMSFNTLALEIKNTTEIYENGTLKDSRTENQSFRYSRKYKLTVKGNDNEIYCDGKTVTRYIPEIKAYAKDKISDDFFDAMINGSPALNTMGLLSGTDYSGRIRKFEGVREEEFKGKKCAVVKITLDGGGQVPDFVQTLYLEDATGIILRNMYEITRKTEENGKETTLTMKVDNVTEDFKINEKISDREFVFVPKKGDREYDPAKEVAEMERQAKLMEQQAKKEQEAQKKKLSEEERKKLEEKAREEFEKNSPIDRQIVNFKASGFSPAAHRGKKMIIVFWAYGMGEEFMNVLESFSREYKDEFELISINVNQKSKGLKDHVAKNKYSIPVYYLDEAYSAKVSEKLQLVTLPAIYFVNETGTVKHAVYGALPKEEIYNLAKEKLTEKEETVTEENTEKTETEKPETEKKEPEPEKKPETEEKKTE